MNKVFSLLLFTGIIVLKSFSQSLAPATVGEAFNFDVGDTLEYSFEISNDPSGQYSSRGYSVIIVDAKSQSVDTIFYTIKRYTKYINHHPPGGFPLYRGPWWSESVSYYFCMDSPFGFYNLDTSLFSPAINHNLNVCVQGGAVCHDTVFNSMEYNSRRQTRYIINGLSDSDVTYVDELGVAMSYHYSAGARKWDTLIYYHKTNGEKWGHFHPIVLGLNDSERSELVSSVTPNPFYNQLTVHVSDNNLVELLLFNSLGQPVLQQSFKKSVTVNTESFPNGVYYFTLINENGVTTKGRALRQ